MRKLNRNHENWAETMETEQKPRKLSRNRVKIAGTAETAELSRNRWNWAETKKTEQKLRKLSRNQGN